MSFKYTAALRINIILLNLSNYSYADRCLLLHRINIYFVFTKGAKKTLAKNSDWTDQKAAWISACCAVGLTILTAAIGVPLLRRHVNKKFDS